MSRPIGAVAGVGSVMGLLVCLSGCGSVASTTTTPVSAPVATVAGGPTHCQNPASVSDLRLGAYVAVEATIVPGHATHDGVSSIIPLNDVKLLWQAVPGNALPRAVEADNVPLAQADLLLPEGRYVLLLGAGTAGHWYLAMGRDGAFAYVDPQGTMLTQMCTTYAATAIPATRAPGSVSRAQVLAWLKQAPLPPPMYSPAPTSS